jgi:AGZA family xanthine/uracil permease-like MFS transporter
MKAALDKIFLVSESGSTFRAEVLGGLTTFMTMSYIIFVQPEVLSTTGMNFEAVMAATCIISALGCFLMAFLANYPIAVAPAMGHNFFFAFTVVAGMHYTWQVALGAVFISGMVFLLMSVIGAREALVQAIPDSLKRGIAVGIGLLITLVGLQWSGLVSANPATLVTLGHLHDPAVWMSACGLLVTCALRPSVAWRHSGRNCHEHALGLDVWCGSLSRVVWRTAIHCSYRFQARHHGRPQARRCSGHLHFLFPRPV